MSFSNDHQQSNRKPKQQKRAKHVCSESFEDIINTRDINDKELHLESTKTAEKDRFYILLSLWSDHKVPLFSH